MQGTFTSSEGRRGEILSTEIPTLDATGVNWQENMTHPNIRRAQPPPPPAAVMPPAPAVIPVGGVGRGRGRGAPIPGAPAAGPAPAPAAGLVDYDIIESPPQRFSLGPSVYFILPRSNLAPHPSPGGHWLVRFIRDVADSDVAPILHPPPAARPANMRRLAKPEGANPDQALTPGEMDLNLTDAEWASVAPFPDPRYCQKTRHFLLREANHFDVGELWLRECVEKAERLDYEFALRMQGLQGSGINAVWTCSDMGAEPNDRPDMMALFLRSYLSRFLSQIPMQSTDDPDAIIREAVQMHEQVFSFQDFF